MLPYEIVENSFHGGHHIAFAHSLLSAAQSANRHDKCSVYDKGQSFPRCCCGGPQIRHSDGSTLTPDETAKLDQIYYDMSCGRIPKR